tara:strand:+ start:809 stop:1642 length:834 start_codon:yes stop_codon:yes gene_type:complete
MSILLNGDCLDEMKELEDDSIDLIFCDLPYGQTSCKWDCKIDLQKFWIEIMRIKKTHTPIFMTTTTKFGVDLINTAPKKCPFRYDLVWVKSAPAGFLSAKKMPMRKHEMIYVFYEKLPFYDLSSHTHKFIQSGDKDEVGKLYRDGVKRVDGMKGKYEPALPTSIVKEELDEKYKNKGGLYSKVSRNGLLKAETHYDPPLPTSALEIKSTKGKHSTEKPVALIEWILKYYSKEGGVVLDPTMGSGSTGVACRNMKRNFIGIELDPEIYGVAVNRIEED